MAGLGPGVTIVRGDALDPLAVLAALRDHAVGNGWVSSQGPMVDRFEVRRRLSIVVSWRNRVELAGALPSLVGSAIAVGGDLTIVNYGGSVSLLRDQVGSYVDEVRIVEVVGERYFNKGRAHNLCSHPPADAFFCDCDIVLKPTVLCELVEQIAGSTGTFGTLAGVRESQRNSRNGKHVVCFGYELRIRTADNRELRIMDHEEDAEDGTRHAPGLLVVRSMSSTA